MNEISTENLVNIHGEPIADLSWRDKWR